MLKHVFLDIREKTSQMNRREKISYIWSYYWYVMLGMLAIIALILVFILHYTIGNKKPDFTCVMVNQKVNEQRDRKMEQSFAKYIGLDAEDILIDSDYNFSYQGLELANVNESTYEKFFFQWRNGELDAVVMSESFYEYCDSLGANYLSLNKKEIGDLNSYEKDGKIVGIVLGNDSFMKALTGVEDEKLLLVFPSDQKHKKVSKKFLEYIKIVNEGKMEDITYAEVING